MTILRSILSFLILAIGSANAFAACTPITLAPADVTAGTVGTPYNLTFSASGSGATPFAYEVTSGVLPGGLNLNAVSGALTGTPTAAGTFPLTVTATDTTGCSGGRAYVLNIAQGNQTITFTSTAPASASVGGATYNVTATATSGLPVAFTIDASASAVCSISGSTVSFIGVGTCVIDANQAGNASYTAAPQVQQSFGVAQGSQTITFTSTAPSNAQVGGPTYNVTATASSGLPVTFSIDASATAVCSISGSTVSFLAIGTCVIDANQAGNANYAAAPQAQQSFGVGKNNQTITFTSTAPAAATVGGATYTVTATASSGLTVAFTIDATASSVCTISGSTVSFIGAGNCVIDADQAGDANYNPAPQVQQTFAVGKGSQTITYTSTAPAGAVVGGPTYTVTATASSGLTVAFTIDASAAAVCSISGSTVSFIGVGNCVIDANQAGNANYNAAPQVQQSFAVGKGNQTISFTSTAPAGATVGGPTYTVTATATSGLAVALTIDATASSVCTISGSTVSFIGVGNCVIDANQAGNANYNAAPQVQQSFAVGQGSQTITFTSTAPASATVGGPTYTVTATASSGLPVTFTIDASASAVCSIAGSTVSFTAAGSCVIDANQAGNANYLPAPQAQQSFPVSKNNQTITFTSTAPAGAVVAGPTYTVSATASSGLTVAFTIDASAASVCSIAGSTVSFIGVGTCVIDANQAGNGAYNPAPQVQQSFAVGKGSQTISFTSTAPVGASVGGPTYTVSATATSGLPVTLTIDASAAAVCSIAGSTVSFIGAGTCVIDANQPGNANYNAAPQVQQSFAVAKGNQTISFTSTPPAGAQFNGPTYTVTATATSGLAVTFTIDATASSVCSISGSTVSFIGVGTCVIDANQAGDANYNAAPQAQQSFAVAKADQTISFTSTPPSPAFVNGTYTVSATATSGLAVTFSSGSAACSVAGSTVTFVAAGNCIVNANQAGNGNYNAAPQVQQSFTIVKNDQTITFTSTAPAGAKVGGPTYTVSATASSGLTVTFTIDAASAGACTIAGSVVTMVHAATCIIDANQAGNAAYNAAPQVQQSFTIAKGDQTITGISTAPSFGASTAAGAPHTYTVTATTTSGLAIVVTIDGTSTAGACSVVSPTVTFGANAGTCVMDIDQPGNADWNPAPQVQQSTTVEIPATAGADSHTVTGNVSINVPAAGVLSNDSGTSIAITSYGATVGNEQTTIGSPTPTAQGGTVSLNANGSYLFVPKPNFNGTDTFKYVLANHVSSVTATVSLIVSDRIMVVTVAGGGSCIPASPCTLATADAAATVSPSKDLIYVEGGTYNAATFSMNNNQKLVGGAVDLNTAITDATIALAPDSVAPTNIAITARPTLNNNANVVVLGGNNLVEYFNINPTGGAAISSNNVTTGATVHDITVAGSGAGAGVNITGNSSGSVFNFSNMVITTAAGAGFSAVGPGPAATTGGTINITTGATPNTLAAVGGVALNVTNTTIGASNLNFRSISANGGANGIILNNTGTSGGLIVLGDGANTSVGGNSTGGTIANMSGADATTNGIGIFLNTTQNVVLRRMTINGTNQGYGIKGLAVNNFVFEYSTVSGTNGTSTALAFPENYGEGSIFFGNANTNGLAGTATFTNDNISGGRARNLSVVNGGAASTGTLTVKGCTFGSMQNLTPIGNQSFAVEPRTGGSTFNVVFGGPAAGEPNTMTGAASDLANFTGQTGTTMDVQFNNNVLSNNDPNNIIGGGSLVLGSQGVMTFNVDSNTMRDANGSAVTLFKASAATSVTGRFTNNTIGVAGLVDSGSKTGNGIFVSAGGGGTMGFTIKNNAIHQIHGNAHIYADNTGGSYAANFTIEGNTLDTYQAASQFAGIAITNGSPSSTDTVNVCAKIGGTTAAEKNTLNLAGNLGVIVGASGAAAGHTFNLPTYAGGANLTNVQNFIQANNAGSFTTSAYNDPPATAAAFTGTGTTCPTP